MKYFLALILPPLAVLACKKPGSMMLNIVLTICGVVPGMIHALIVVNDFETDRRQDRLIRAMTALDRQKKAS